MGSAAIYLVKDVLKEMRLNSKMNERFHMKERKIRMNKIYCFSNVLGGGDGIAYAMGDDGFVLGRHWCSSEYYVPQDLGVTEGCRPDRHITYAEHFQNGYEMEFIPAREVKSHEGLSKAFELNQIAAKKSKENE